ncbi:MAG TPA: phenylalanine--tRNA ligase subunit alpha [Vicinamibacteria bacterium]|nr:phenylalanine--tRNA ligase subunit alpha [Vicinamibacteria bacterium]
MTSRTEPIRKEALEGLERVSDAAELEAWRIAHMGRKSPLSTLLRSLGELSSDERRSLGQAVNALKEELSTALVRKQESLERARFEETVTLGRIDVSLPARPLALGRLHPVTQTQREVLDAFVAQGFSVIEGPEVELDYYNFEALRIPKDHPARELMDTFYVDREDDGDAKLVLRTHTSPNQIRFMEKHRPPLRIVCPGRIYRNEATDPTHEWMCTQTEVLAVDEGLTLAHLKGTLFELAKRLFGQDRKIRFRCDFFPFVEPGVDMAIDCFLCGGSGCRTCKNEGWIEILGAGMVHPEILENMGYDPEVFTGFAAGLGVERIAMLRNGIDDIRAFYENDLRFLSQF